MHKLIVLFEPPDDEQAFQLDWQKFLGLAERMPGLRHETVSRVERVLFGKSEGRYVLLHELLFDSKEDLETAMQSPEGQAAGKFLQSSTGGRVVIGRAYGSWGRGFPKERAGQVAGRERRRSQPKRAGQNRMTA